MERKPIKIRGAEKGHTTYLVKEKEERGRETVSTMAKPPSPRVVMAWAL